MGIKDQATYSTWKAAFSKKYNKLDSSHLKALGNAYLAAYPAPTPRFTLFSISVGTTHTNQSQAKELSEFDGESSKQAWTKLIEVFRSLPNKDGELAKQIINLFIEKFDLKTVINGPAGGPVPQDFLADDMTQHIEAKFNSTELAEILRATGR